VPELFELEFELELDMGVEPDIAVRVRSR